MPSDLARAVEYVLQVTAKSAVPPDPKEVRRRVTRLFEEGVDFKQLVTLLIARSHAKEEEKIFGLRKSDHLTFDDLTEVEKALGINELNEENRAIWAKKFESGRAQHWCPRCGYAGNEEFKAFEQFLICYLCGFIADPRYFTRKWKPGEQASFEAGLEAKRQAAEARQIADREFRNRRAMVSAAVHNEAVAAAKEIDKFVYVEMVDDEESYEWDIAASGWMVHKLGQLIARAAVSGDDVVAYFKANLKPPDELDSLPAEFDRVAAEFAAFKQEEL